MNERSTRVVSDTGVSGDPDDGPHRFFLYSVGQSELNIYLSSSKNSYRVYNVLGDVPPGDILH